MCSAVKNEVITWVIICVILFPMYVYMRYALIPAMGNTCTTNSLNLFIDPTTAVTLADVLC